MSPRALREVMCRSRAVCRLGLGLTLLALPSVSAAQADRARIDITGRQNLTLGSGARAMGMGGAFLARADDATAAAWNPAGLSYLRLPEVSLVGVRNRFAVDRPTASVKTQLNDTFQGNSIDFAAATWPLAIRGVRGALQLSYQRAISFDGTRDIQESGESQRADYLTSSGGFDVIALGAGFRLTRSLRAGITVNRWLSGYDQSYTRTVPTDTRRPQRVIEHSFRPSGWNFNVGVMWSPIEPLNVAAIYKTPFTAGVELVQTRHDTWVLPSERPQVTTNSYSSDSVRLDFPASFGFGLSWRARETLTVSADVTQTRWSKARIRGFFDLNETGPAGSDGVPATPPAPTFQPELQYPSLAPMPQPGDREAQLTSQKDKQEIRIGAEWVLIRGAFRIPLRAGYFNDRQMLQSPSGKVPRFNGVTVGVGVGIGAVLVDVAYVYEYGKYSQNVDVETADGGTVPITVRNSLTANRIYASVIVRLPGRP